MNRHHGKARFAALAASACSIVAVASLGSAGSAMALTCESGGFASGSSLQSEAQNKVWLPAGGFGKHLGGCSALPTVTYTGTSSGEGLDEFGNNTGVLNEEKDKAAFTSGSSIVDTKGKVLDWYVGTDDAPNVQQLNNSITASGDLHGNLEEITVPVAQAPVALMLSMPEGCKIFNGSAVEVDGKTLVQLWEGKNPANAETNDLGGLKAQGGYKGNTWGALFVQLGYTKVAKEEELTKAGQFFDAGGVTGCEQEITLQARSTYSGTSFAFKSYLDENDNQLFFNTTSKTFATENVWDGYISDAPSWPVTVSVTGNKKGGELAKKTAETPGSVGYANTADAVSKSNGEFSHHVAPSTLKPGHQIVYALIQNNVGQITQQEAEGVALSAKQYADPVAAGEEGNCETDKTISADRHTPYSIVDSWYGITASDPNIGVDDTSSIWYPICALTYDLAWHHYAAAALYPSGPHTEIGNTVREFFQYAAAGAGQTDVKTKYYDGTPISASPQWRAFIEAEIKEIK
jgi:ABC-type phosphate transport system substrate-binding protein